MRRSSFSLAMGVATLSMMLGFGRSFGATDREMVIDFDDEPVKTKPTKVAVRDYSAWDRRRVNVPHIGDKQRRRHAGRPDGLMHRETPNLRSNANKRLAAAAQAVAEPVKKTRKPRAKKADTAAA